MDIVFYLPGLLVIMYLFYKIYQVLNTEHIESRYKVKPLRVKFETKFDRKSNPEIISFLELVSKNLEYKGRPYREFSDDRFNSLYYEYMSDVLYRFHIDSLREFTPKKRIEVLHLLGLDPDKYQDFRSLYERNFIRADEEKKRLYIFYSTDEISITVEFKYKQIKSK